MRSQLLASLGDNAFMHILIIPSVFFQNITRCSYGRQALVPDISKE
jgi:hypothetical protein